MATCYVSFVVQIKQREELTCLSVFSFSSSLMQKPRVFIPWSQSGQHGTTDGKKNIVFYNVSDEEAGV